MQPLIISDIDEVIFKCVDAVLHGIFEAYGWAPSSIKDILSYRLNDYVIDHLKASPIPECNIPSENEIDRKILEILKAEGRNTRWTYLDVAQTFKQLVFVEKRFQLQFISSRPISDRDETIDYLAAILPEINPTTIQIGLTRKEKATTVLEAVNTHPTRPVIYLEDRASVVELLFALQRPRHAPNLHIIAPRRPWNTRLCCLYNISRPNKMRPELVENCVSWCLKEMRGAHG
jgi:hypothetical protein